MARMSWTSQQVATSVRRAVALQREEFARRLVALREQHDPPLTQEQAAELIGVDPRHYHRWENRETDPYLSTRAKIAKAYGIDVSYLIAEPGAPLGLGLDGTNDQLTRLEAKLDQIIRHLGIETPADQAPTAAPPPAPPTILRPQQPAQRPTRAKRAPAAKTPATSRRRRAP